MAARRCRQSPAGLRPLSDFSLVMNFPRIRSLPIAPELHAEPKARGYEGEACPECMNFTLVQSGTCVKHDTCGSTTGCPAAEAAEWQAPRHCTGVAPGKVVPLTLP
jgi:hypothetical protein